MVYILPSHIFSSVLFICCFAVKQHIFIFNQIFSSLNLIVCGSPPGNLSEVRSPYTNVSHFGFLKDNLHYQPKNHYSLEPIFYCLSFSLFFLCLVVLGFFNFVLFYFVTALCPYLSFSFFFFFCSILKVQNYAPFSNLVLFSCYLV